MKTDLYDLIIRSADSGVALQGEQGVLPRGHSGPRKYEDTYVRTTAHWALTFFKAYELTQEMKYLDAAIRACDYLITEDARPLGYSFYCTERNNGKCLCNGLIGQAWAIEPLITTGSSLRNDKYIDVARRILSIIPYDFRRHSWFTVDVDGSNLGEHTTLNQQVWMTAMGIMFGKSTGDDYFLRIGIDFYAHIHEKIVFLGDGLIGQMIKTKQPWVATKLFTKRILSRRFLVERSQAYLTFLLYGIALAYEYSSEERFWRDEGLRRLIGDAIDNIERNYPYGFLEDSDSFRWSYNPIGIEMAYIMETFSKYVDTPSSISSDQTIQKWLSKQFEGYYNTDADLLINNTTDPNVLAARLYEATRIRNTEIVF
jgi:hypothetical protein